MRMMMLVLCAWAFSVGLSGAQKPAPAERPLLSAPAPSEAEGAAARAMLAAFVIESGLLDAVLDQAVAEELPQLHALTNDPALRAEIGPERYARVQAFLDTLPAIVREEVQRAVPAAIELSAPAIAELFTEEEMAGILAFLQREDTRDLIRRMARNQSDLTAADIALAEQFGRSRAGRAFIRHGDAMFAVLEQALDEITPGMIATLTQRVAIGMCEPLGDACPANLREQTGPI